MRTSNEGKSEANRISIRLNNYIKMIGAEMEHEMDMKQVIFICLIGTSNLTLL